MFLITENNVRSKTRLVSWIPPLKLFSFSLHSHFALVHRAALRSCSHGHRCSAAPLDCVHVRWYWRKKRAESVRLQPLSEMEVTRQEQRSYAKISMLRGRNAKECHSELTEALGNRALPYRTVYIDEQLHSSVGELLVPTCIKRDVQELCTPRLRMLWLHSV